MQGRNEICWCFPKEYEDCNNNCHGMCEALTENCGKNQKCKFYKSRKDTSDEEMRKWHKATWKGSKYVD